MGSKRVVVTVAPETSSLREDPQGTQLLYTIVTLEAVHPQAHTSAAAAPPTVPTAAPLHPTATAAKGLSQTAANGADCRSPVNGSVLDGSFNEFNGSVNGGAAGIEISAGGPTLGPPKAGGGKSRHHLAHDPQCKVQVRTPKIPVTQVPLNPKPQAPNPQP